MPFEDAADYRFNPFDITKVWPHKDYPLIPIGRMVLDRNPDNFFAQVDAGRVRGGEPRPGHRAQPGPDGAGADVRLRRLAPLSHGPNYDAAADQQADQRGAQLQQGRPDALPATVATSRSTRRTATAARGPTRSATAIRAGLWKPAEIMRTAYMAHKEDNDFIQPGTLYRKVMTPADRDHLAGNIVWHLSQGVERFIQERAVNDYWAKVDPDLGTRVAHGLGLATPAR